MSRSIQCRLLLACVHSVYLGDVPGQQTGAGRVMGMIRYPTLLHSLSPSVEHTCAGIKDHAELYTAADWFWFLELGRFALFVVHVHSAAPSCAAILAIIAKQLSAE